MTARELARSIAPDDEQAVFERIRHWTRERLLTPENRHPGTGNSRLYSSSLIGKAKIFNVLANFGVTVQTLDRVAAFIDSGRDDDRKAVDDLLNAVKGFL